MNTDNPQDEPTPEPAAFEFPQFITPENVTSEQRAALAEQWNAELFEGLRPVYDKLRARSREAASAQNAEGLQREMQAAKTYEALISKWNDGLEKRACPNLIALQQAFGHQADDIAAALNGELPGQRDDDAGDEWKKDR